MAIGGACGACTGPPSIGAALHRCEEHKVCVCGCVRHGLRHPRSQAPQLRPSSCLDSSVPPIIAGMQQRAPIASIEVMQGDATVPPKAPPRPAWRRHPTALMYLHPHRGHLQRIVVISTQLSLFNEMQAASVIKGWPISCRAAATQPVQMAAAGAAAPARRSHPTAPRDAQSARRGGKTSTIT